MKENEIKERLTLKQYITNLDYMFEEFDKEEYDGSYYTTWGKLGEFELFTEEQINEAIEEGPSESGIIYFDEATEEDLDDILCYLVNNLDQGAIKLLEIKDGENILYHDDNDEPFED